MASPSTVVTLGFGSFGSVNLLPTLGFANAEASIGGTVCGTFSVTARVGGTAGVDVSVSGTFAATARVGGTFSGGGCCGSE